MANPALLVATSVLSIPACSRGLTKPVRLWHHIHVTEKLTYGGDMAVGADPPDERGAQPEFACPVCNSDSVHHLDVADWGEMRRCETCGLVFANPLVLPQDPKQFFTRAYLGQVSVHQMEEFSRRLANVPDPSDKRSFDQALGPTKRKALSWIKRNFPEGSTVLDIGCGRGDFLRALKGAGFHPAGVDPAEPVVQMLQEEGFLVWHGTVEELPKGVPEPVVCTCFLVLHHSPDPLEFISTIIRQFPRSMLLISDCSEWRDPSRRPPRHFTVWSKRSLRIALSKAGYEAEVMTGAYCAPSGVPGGRFLLWLGLRSLHYRLAAVWSWSHALYRRLRGRSEIILACAKPRGM